MSELMRNLRYVWNTGDCLDWLEPNGHGGVDRIDLFQKETNAAKVVRLRWSHGQKTIECDFPASVLPDRTGVVLMDEWHMQDGPRTSDLSCRRHLRVLNADGSLRLRLYPPQIDERSVIEDSWIEPPGRYPEHGVPFGAPAYDGWRDMLLDIDWQTGALLRWVLAPWLRY